MYVINEMRTFVFRIQYWRGKISSFLVSCKLKISNEIFNEHPWSQKAETTKIGFAFQFMIVKVRKKDCLQNNKNLQTITKLFVYILECCLIFHLFTRLFHRTMRIIDRFEFIVLHKLLADLHLWCTCYLFTSKTFWNNWFCAENEPKWSL